MQRYLFWITYDGSNFSGFQSQLPRTILANQNSGFRLKAVKTVQGAIETSIYRLKPYNEVRILSSSRTDAGVHAISSTCSADLLKDVNVYFDPKKLTSNLNCIFASQKLGVRILKTLAVPGNVDVRRNAISRTYLYRLAVLKNKEEIIDNDAINFHFQRSLNLDYLDSNNRTLSKRVKKLKNDLLMFDLPLPDSQNIHVIKWSYLKKFDENIFRQALSKFSGTHNFATFMSTRGLLRSLYDEGIGCRRPMKIEDCVRSILEVEIKRAVPPLDPDIELIYGAYDFYNIKIKGHSFLYNQVRRMIGAALGVAKGLLTVSDIEELLKQANPLSWPNCIHVTPANALYLVNVAYPTGVLAQGTECLSDLPLDPPDPKYFPMIKINY